MMDAMNAPISTKEHQKEFQEWILEKSQAA